MWALKSAVNVNLSALSVHREEFTRGKLILDDMQLKVLSSPAAWTQLFCPSDFALRYDHYLQLRLTASTPSALNEYGNYVASRLRRLVETLQHTSSVMTVHPFPNLNVTRGEEGSYFVGFEIEHCDRRKPLDVQASVAPVIKYFLATEMQNMSHKSTLVTSITANIAYLT